MVIVTVVPLQLQLQPKLNQYANSVSELLDEAFNNLESQHALFVGCARASGNKATERPNRRDQIRSDGIDPN